MCHVSLNFRIKLTKKSSHRAFGPPVGALDVRARSWPRTNSGLKPFYTEISLKKWWKAAVHSVNIRDLKQTTTATATRTPQNKRFNEQNNSCARAL